jgi:hypothetical protein
VLNNTETQLTVSLSFSNLTGPETEANIHGHAAPGVNARALYDLPLGTFQNQIITLHDIGAYRVAQQVSDLKDGLLYIDVHTTVFPQGEIRGPILIPEPSALILFGIGAGLVGLITWRRSVAR